MLATHRLPLESRVAPQPRVAKRPREVLVDEPRHIFDRLAPLEGERVGLVGRAGRLTFEPLAGGRFMWVDTSLGFPNQKVSDSGSVIDPMFGGRITWRITDTVTLRSRLLGVMIDVEIGGES